MMNAEMNLEISALHRIGAERNIDGERITYAYGYGNDLLADEQRESLFEIVIDGDHLLATVDCHSAAGRPVITCDEADAWEAAKLYLTAPVTRYDFQELARVARCLIAGRDIRLPDGRVLSGIRPKAKS